MTRKAEMPASWDSDVVSVGGEHNRWARKLLGAAVVVVLAGVGVMYLGGQVRKFFATPCGGSSLALNRSIANGDGEDVRDRVAYGADLNERDADGVTPLGCAVDESHFEMAHLLIENHADATTIGGHRQQKLLDDAVTRDNATELTFLFAHGVGDGVVPGQINEEISAAVDHDAEQVMPMLVAHGGDHNSGLRQAVYSDKAGAARGLLSAGADPNGLADTNTLLETPASPRPSLLTWAAFTDSDPMVDALLSHGASPEFGGLVDQPALVLALSHIQDVSPKGPSGTLVGVFHGEARLPGEIHPLIAAAARGRPTMVHRLLAAGADPNAVSLGIYTPLYAAVISNNVDVVNTLLGAGATTRPAVAAGVLTPLELARANNRTAIAEALEAADRTQSR